jgi:preprotein translocase subunit SecB
MLQSPVNLEHYHLTRIEITPVEGWLSSESSLYPEFSGAEFGAEINIAEINGERVPNPPAYTITIHLNCKPKSENSFPYQFKIGATGFISYRGNKTGDERIDLVTINGCALVYGILRDTIYALTMRLQNGPIMLPTVTFLDMKKDFIAAKPATPAKALSSRKRKSTAA